MTVGDYLSSLVFGLDLPDTVLERSAMSPLEVELDPLSLDDIVELANSEFRKRLDYAASTVYYSVLGVFAGGGYSEQVGDVRVSKSGCVVTDADRNRFLTLANSLREKHGFATEEAYDSGGMYDMTQLRDARH